MGIFSDKCTNCGFKVKKQARFCTKCGTPAPKGWWRCYSCEEFVGNDSSHCWNCNAEFKISDRVKISDGSWKKDKNIFAQNFDIRDLKTVLSNGIKVLNGNNGAIVKNAEVVKFFEPDQYDINEYIEQPSQQNYSLILFDGNDVALPVHIKSAKSNEGYDVDFYGEIIIGIDECSLPTFINKHLSNNSQVTYEDLSELLIDRITNTVNSFCLQSTIDKLVEDASNRIYLGNKIETDLANFTCDEGLIIKYISSAEFYGEQYDNYLKENADLDLKRKEQEREFKLNELLSSAKMKNFKNENELNKFQLQLAHEFKVDEDTFNRERVIMKEAWKKQDDLDNLSHEFNMRLFSIDKESEINRKITEQEIELSAIRNKATREESVKDAQSRSDVRKIDFNQEKEETEQALKWREEKAAIKIREKEADLERRKKLSDLELLTDIDDSDKRKDLVEMMKLQKMQEMSIEEILAIKSSESSAAADALARIKENKKNDVRE